jgi:hypothetical protein
MLKNLAGSRLFMFIDKALALNYFCTAGSLIIAGGKAMKANNETKKPEYVRPRMQTVVTPREIRDIDQPCAFYEPKPNPKPTEN